MKVYNSIPTEFKPPIGSSQVQYAEDFDSKFTLWLSERRSASLVAMMKYFIEVEVNLTTARKKKRDEGEWRREEGERGERTKNKEPEKPSTSSSQESRIDTMLRTMERMMERVSVYGRPPPKENQEQQKRNQNARRPQVI